MVTKLGYTDTELKLIVDTFKFPLIDTFDPKYEFPTLDRIPPLYMLMLLECVDVAKVPPIEAFPTFENAAFTVTLGPLKANPVHTELLV
jgi:hypothetical protein